MDAGGMFKLMHFADLSLFDDLLTSARKQLPQIATDGWNAHWIFYRAAQGWRPFRGHRAGVIHISVQVQRHCHPCVKWVPCLRGFACASRPRVLPRLSCLWQCFDENTTTLYYLYAHVMTVKQGHTK